MLSNKAKKQLHLLQERYPSYPEILEFVECIKQKSPLLVLLFGSLATGEFTQNSDADMLTVFEQPEEWTDVYKCSSGVVQPIVQTREVLLEEINNGNTFLIEALEDGIVMYEESETYAQLVYAVQQAKDRHNLVRESRGWRRGKDNPTHSS